MRNAITGVVTIGWVRLTAKFKARIGQKTVAKQGYSGVLAKAKNNLVKLVGDSRTLLATDNTGWPLGRFYFETRSPVTWARPGTGYRFNITSPTQYGVGGDASDDLLARFDPVVADPAAITILLIGTNDRGHGLTLQQSKDNITTMLRRLHVPGCVTILANETPRGDPNALVGSLLTDHVALHTWLTTVAPKLYDNIVPWDTWTPMLDPATDGSTYAPKTGFTVDGLHFSTEGGFACALNLTTALDSILPVKDSSRPYTAGEVTVTPILTQNPDMTGSAGSAGPGISGAITNSWTATLSSGAAGITVVGTKEVVNSVEWQVFTFSGTPTGASPVFTFRPNLNASGVGGGDSYDMRALMQLAAGSSGILHVCPEARVDGTDIVQSRACDGYQAPDNAPAAGFNLLMLTPPAIIPASGVTTIRGEIVATFTTGTAVSAVVKIAAAGARKVLV